MTRQGTPASGAPRVLFITTGLATGGAERMLCRLLPGLVAGGLEVGVVSLRARGGVSGDIEAMGVPVWHLGLDSARDLPLAAMRLRGVARGFRPDVVQGWMYHGNLAAWLLRALWSRRARLCWSVRQSLPDLGLEKPGTRRVIRACSRVSAGVDAIVYNALLARRQHEAIGYASAPGRLIDNGFDTDVFRPDAEAAADIRRELGLMSSGRLIGLIARFHAMKGHEVFLRAAASLAARAPDVHFLLAGQGVDAANPVLAPWLVEPALLGRVHPLGERADVPALTCALDVATSASLWGDAFHNSLGEAMSCGVPCVATDVGDARRIVGDTGLIVPPGDPEALAGAWARLLALPTPDLAALGAAARRRVRECFSLDHAVAGYRALYLGEHLAS